MKRVQTVILLLSLFFASCDNDPNASCDNDPNKTRIINRGNVTVRILPNGHVSIYNTALSPKLMCDDSVSVNEVFNVTADENGDILTITLPHSSVYTYDISFGVSFIKKDNLQ